MAGANPIILVVTKVIILSSKSSLFAYFPFWLLRLFMHHIFIKVDLLPKGTDFNCVGDWVVEATMKKKLK